VAPVVGSDYQRSGAVVGNTSNVNSISSFNYGINTGTTGTRNDELCRANSSFKRSRSPDHFTKGDTSNQGSQINGRFSRRRTLLSPFHPYQDNVNNAMEIKKKVQSFIDESKAVAANPLPKVFSKQLSTIVNYCKKHGAVKTNFAKDKFDVRFVKELKCNDMKNLFLCPRYLTRSSRVNFLMKKTTTKRMVGLLKMFIKTNLLGNLESDVGIL